MRAKNKLILFFSFPYFLSNPTSSLLGVYVSDLFDVFKGMYGHIIL